MAAVCKFFLGGYCKFGSRCKFRHPYNNVYQVDHRHEYEEYTNRNEDQNRQSKGYSGVSILRSCNNSSYSPQNYSTQRQQYSSNASSSNTSHNQNLFEIWKVMVKEVEALEVGHQWPLTCFCLGREYSNVLGWVDHSPEELRWEVYKTTKEGFEQCKESINLLYKNAELRRNELKLRDSAIPIIERMLIKNEVSSMENNISPVTNSAPLFGSEPVPFNNSWNNSTTQQQQGWNNPIQIAQSAPSTGVFNSQAFQNPSQSFVFSLPPQQQHIQSPDSGSIVRSTNSLSPFPGTVTGTPQPTLPSNPLFSGASTINNVGQTENYSNISELTESELTEFQAKAFKFGQIPLKPPPKELC